jgi:hypothetical protein
MATTGRTKLCFMKIKLTGFTDNTYAELKTIELDNVMSVAVNAEDGFLNVSYYEGGAMKTTAFTSLQWGQGVQLTP